MPIQSSKARWLIAGWFSVSILVPSWRYPIPFAASWQQRWQKKYLHEWLIFMVNVGNWIYHTWILWEWRCFCWSFLQKFHKHQHNINLLFADSNFLVPNTRITFDFEGYTLEWTSYFANLVFLHQQLVYHEPKFLVYSLLQSGPL